VLPRAAGSARTIWAKLLLAHTDTAQAATNLRAKEKDMEQPLNQDETSPQRR